MPSREVDRRSAATESRADDQLLSALALALREIDPVPAALVEAGKAAFSWRTVDAALAELVTDTALEATQARGFSAPRTLTFVADDTTLVLEVVEHKNTRRLLGQIVAPRRADVEVAHTSGAVTVAADDLGRFRIEEFPAGPIRLSVRFPGGTSRVVTSWVNV